MVVTDKVFDCCSVLVDDRVYINCTFDQCTLIYSQSIFPEFVDCSFEDCEWCCMDPVTGEHIGDGPPDNPFEIDDDDEEDE